MNTGLFGKIRTGPLSTEGKAVLLALAVLFGLNVADYAITVVALSMGACELNPLYNAGFGLVVPKILVGLAVAVIMANYFIAKRYALKPLRVSVLLCLLGLNLYYAYVLIHNFLVILQLV